ncbi:hypothetical protein [Sulfuriflexus mobilis]|uniref:hypothetical protein n=1 Tax=Sulfuriflexus mobilis TaxID=1811807 RepID=UPI000F839A46|nr:hypothetical protein [Sulfuriflexus mobilis]
MDKHIISIALAGTLALGLAGHVNAAETFEVAGQKFTVWDAPAEQGKVIDTFNVGGQKYVIREDARGAKQAELAIFEVIPGVDDLLYADDDAHIVMTGAR